MVTDAASVVSTTNIDSLADVHGITDALSASSTGMVGAIVEEGFIHTSISAASDTIQEASFDAAAVNSLAVEVQESLLSDSSAAAGEDAFVGPDPACEGGVSLASNGIGNVGERDVAANWGSAIASGAAGVVSTTNLVDGFADVHGMTDALVAASTETVDTGFMDTSSAAAGDTLQEASLDATAESSTVVDAHDTLLADPSIATGEDDFVGPDAEGESGVGLAGDGVRHLGARDVVASWGGAMASGAVAFGVAVKSVAVAFGSAIKAAALCAGMVLGTARWVLGVFVLLITAFAYVASSLFSLASTVLSMPRQLSKSRSAPGIDTKVDDARTH
mmetsp:Transcript_91265/g.293119  ORF Transcript_91265/g.293119 Transcript_91265/m.293119 type:complete len:333 (-) Transcript_91265:269-1267(-)